MNGIRNTIGKALILAVFTCLVVVPAATPARNTAFHPKIMVLGLNKVQVSFTTPTPTFASVSTSTNSSPGLTVLDRRMKKVHSFTIPENAGKTFNIKVVATPAKGKPSTYVDTFETGALGSPSTTVTARNNKFLLNGVPFFPIMAPTGTCLSEGLVSNILAMGVNIFEDPAGCDSDTSTWPAAMDQLLHGKAWVYASKPNTQQNLQSVPEYLLWQGGIRLLQEPASLVGCSDFFASTKPLFVTASSQAKKGATIYRTKVVEKSTPRSSPYCLDGVGMKNLFFTSVASGVGGLELFNFIPETGAMDVRSDVSQAIGQAASCMDNVGTAFLNGKSIAVKVDPKGQLVARAWIYGGVTYIIAVNTAKSSTSSPFTVPGLAKAKTATTLCEPTKTVKFANGTATMSFSPLGVHLLKVVLPFKK